MLSHEIVNSEPYTFLDDAPLEERRARQVQLRRGLPVEARDLSRLDAAALEKVRAQVAPAPAVRRSCMTCCLSTLVHRARADWQDWFQELVASRAGHGGVPGGGASSRRRRRRVTGPAPPGLWCATERRQWAEALFPGAELRARLPAAREARTGEPSPAKAGAAAARARHRADADAGRGALAVRGHLELTGPATAEGLASAVRLTAGPGT